MPNNKVGGGATNVDDKGSADIANVLDGLGSVDELLAKAAEDATPQPGVRRPKPKEDDRDDKRETPNVDDSTNEEPPADDKAASEGDSKDTDVKAVDSTEAAEGEEDLPPVAEYVISNLGLEGFDPATYPDSYDGIQKLVNDVAAKRAEQIVSERIGKDPTLKKFAEFIENGGNAADFVNASFPSEDYHKVEVNESDTPLQEYLLKQDLVAQGWSEEDATEEIATRKEAGSLYKSSLRALKQLRAKQDKTQADLLTKQAQAAAAAKQADIDYWNGLKSELTKDGKNTFSGITIPESEKADFVRYMTEDVPELGQPQLHADNANLTPEQELALFYLIYKKVDLSGIVTAAATKLQADGLSSRLSGNRKAKVSGKDDGIVPTTQAQVDAALEALNL